MSRKNGLLASVSWIGLAQGVKIGLQALSAIVLVRLLPQEAYGLMSMAMVVTSFAGLFRDMGTGAALIQKRNLTAETTSTVFWINVGLGGIVALVIASVSPAVALWFHEPELIKILCLLALMFPIQSACVVPEGLLEREAEFAKVACIEITSAVLAFVMALILAMRGAGVYALVMQQLFSSVVAATILWSVSHWRPSARWASEELKALLSFSGNLSLFQFVNYFARNADSMIVGRFLGATTLGTYSLAYKIMLYPLTNLVWVGSRALLPAMSRLQDTPERMGELYLKSLSVIAFATAPLMAGLWVLREPFVLIVLGQNWLEVADILAWLAPVGFIQTIISPTGVIYIATGRTRLMMKVGVLSTFLQVGSFVLGAQWGIEGVVVCYFFANLINAIPAIMISTRIIGLRITQVLKCIARPLFCALLMLGVIWAARLYAAMFLDERAVASLIGLTGIGILSYMVLSWLFLQSDIRRALALSLT